MAEAEGVPGLLCIHMEVDQVAQDLHLSLWLLISAHHPKGEDRSSVFRDEARDDRVKRTFVRFQPVGVIRIEVE